MFDPGALLEARLWVARLGESDVQGWWRTDGILGPDGAFVGPRVLPRTHATARARIAFAVASHACNERHPDREVHHLFRVDPVTEDRLDALLVERLADKSFWGKIIAKLEAVTAEADPGDVLIGSETVGREDLEVVGELDLGPAGRSLQVPSKKSPEEQLRLLVAGFVRAQPKTLVVPYIPKASKA